ncbi:MULTISPECIES: hypothetical protein [Bacillus]|uniref:Uncharacterized protein n=1 Tax=Bacillus glycinifermentans TaxID=1664069 RepID=A0ABU6H822_9BACI|nr:MULTISPECIES: hypothetical protein [Bacillus]MEC0342581.1 hypothetical protein [Bacillus sonorensis]MEC0457458.1 hypothetical protein [Bacillus sonorensis]MEC0487141.1 hypothetical protein [Bacillus glycinifermentans]MEC0530747.1 hypothetical protein [Bacillus sonorensis]UBF35350.1 hypothetical protein K9N56_23690 [Bacillus sp. PM8313]
MDEDKLQVIEITVYCLSLLCVVAWSFSPESIQEKPGKEKDGDLVDDSLPF